MTIETRINRVVTLLNRVKKYADLVSTDNFEKQTLADMKGNVKDILDEAKDEIGEIKSEVDNW
ncbi:unnamed protein product [marine sediment metagenome]|uniref:Uncharacterized protein n=1 Tax=marine sediment metagenome TaxID=412755 RepID=X1KLV8_9ZZZZ